MSPRLSHNNNDESMSESSNSVLDEINEGGQIAQPMLIDDQEEEEDDEVDDDVDPININIALQ